jgi:branched-chain amino acid transport system permease protein
MGFTALGGLSAVLVAEPPVAQAWAVGGWGILWSFVSLVCTVIAIMVARRLVPAYLKLLVTIVLIIAGVLVIRIFYIPAVDRIEAVDPAHTGYLGGMNLPILVSWAVGGLVAAGAGWLIGKVSLGLRADYLAIATLGISEIIISIVKYEDWLTRGVKNVTGLPRPVPYEVSLQKSGWFVNVVHWLGGDVANASSVAVKLCYAGLFLVLRESPQITLGPDDARHPGQS